MNLFVLSVIFFWVKSSHKNKAEKQCVKISTYYLCFEPPFNIREG